MTLKGSASRYCFELRCSSGDHQLIKWRDAHCDGHQTIHDPSFTVIGVLYILQA